MFYSHSVSGIVFFNIDLETEIDSTNICSKKLLFQLLWLPAGLAYCPVAQRKLSSAGYDAHIQTRRLWSTINVRNKIPKIGSKTLFRLRFTFPLNKSDDTIGWNGRITGYSVYYSHFQDSMVEQKHSILITPKLTPIVSLQNVKRTFLGKPFTNCHQTNATNRWEYE